MNTPAPSPPTDRELHSDAPAPLAGSELPVLPSATLLRGQKAVAIDHNG